MLVTFIRNTKTKIYLAKVIYKILKLFIRNDIRIVKRRGITYKLDISEGIDLSVYLFGNFQKYITKNNLVQIPKNSVIFDIGANIGIMSLNYAKLYPTSSVYAFEPTDYAYSKLIENIKLNQDIASRIIPVKAFLTSEKNKKNVVYSSWKLINDNDIEKTRHPIHHGIEMGIGDAISCTIDEFTKINNISKIALMKIDTDGNEYDILCGARNTIVNNRPYIIFECGLYLLKEKGISFSDFYEFFKRNNYILFDLKNNKRITEYNFTKKIPSKGTIDILSVPAEKYYKKNA